MAMTQKMRCLIFVMVCGWAAAQQAQRMPAKCLPAMRVNGVPCPTPAYSMTQVIVHTQTLSDGTQIRTRTVMKEAQDTEGRRRTETIPDAFSGNPAQEQISIIDPISNRNIILYPQRKVAQLNLYRNDAPTQLPAVDKEREEKLRAFFKAIQPSPEEMRANMHGNQQQNCSNEKAGDETFDGMTVDVSRMVCVIPTGSQGNDREMRSITEFWVLPDIGITVRSVEDSPLGGHTEMTVEDFQRTPPDPALFQIPADYSVFDMSVPQRQSSLQ